MRAADVRDDMLNGFTLLWLAAGGELRCARCSAMKGPESWLCLHAVMCKASPPDDRPYVTTTHTMMAMPITT